MILSSVCFCYADSGRNEAEFKQVLSTAILCRSETLDCSEYNLTSDDINLLLKHVLAENGYFYFDSSYYWNDFDNDGIVDLLQFGYLYDEEETQAMMSAIEERIDEITALTENTADNTEKVKIVYAYFVDNFVYDSVLPNYGGMNDIYNLFVNGKGKCYAFSIGFKTVMDRLDIPCKVATNDNLNHEWNKVYVNNQWLNVDITKKIYLGKC